MPNLNAITKYTGDVVDDFLFARRILKSDLEESTISYVPQHLVYLKDFLELNDNIAVFGDCDVDGLSALAIVKIYLDKYLPNKKVKYFVGNRSIRGFQLSDANRIIDEFGEVEAILTVDSGIAAVEAAELCKREFIELFITDHHEPKEILPDCIIINPHLDHRNIFKEFCGAGLIYLALKNIYGEEEYALQYAGIATVADMVQLKEDNRAIVKQAILSIKKNPSPILAKFIKTLNILFATEKDIGWNISPVVNSASRMSQEQVAYNAFVLGDHESIIKLKDINQERKKLLKEVSEDVKLRAIVYPYCIAYEAKDNIGGLVGLIATQLYTSYGLPAIVCSQINEQKYALSLRSPHAPEFIAHFKTENEEVEGGGHFEAAGFSVIGNSPTEIFDKFNQWCYTVHSAVTEETVKPYDADIEIELHEIIELFTELDSLRPFGMGFEEPIYYTKNVEIVKNGTTSGGYAKYLVKHKNGDVLFMDIKGLFTDVAKEEEMGKMHITYKLSYNLMLKRPTLDVISYERVQ